MKNNYHHNLKFEQTTFKSQKLMLVGKEFNRDVKGFTLVVEALQVLFIAAFIHWCRTFDYIDQIPSAFWNALFEFHRCICDQTIGTSVLLTKVEKLFEDHVQPLISQLRKWGCDASPTFKPLRMNKK
jgi:hypothetical protein